MTIDELITKHKTGEEDLTLEIYEHPEIQKLIKIHRSILNWEWYTDVNVRLTFIHFLMKANYEDKKWKGIHIPRGSFISSIGHLSAEIGISVRQLRTAIKKLKATNEITSQSSASNTMITVVSYDQYQQLYKCCRCYQPVRALAPRGSGTD